MATKDPDLIKYRLRGTAGDEAENEDVELGDEIVLVMRTTVAKVADHLNGDHILVRDVTLQATAAYVVDGELPASIKKQLRPAEQDKVAGADRLPVG
jgi:hypothetical protein